MERFIFRNIRMVIVLTSLRTFAKQPFFILTSLRATAKQSTQIKVTDYFVVPPRNDGSESILSSLQVFIKDVILPSLRTNVKQSFFVFASLRTIAKQSVQINVTDYFVVPPRNDGSILCSAFNKQILFN